MNNAGVMKGAAFEDFPESDWDQVMDINSKSLFFLTQQLLTTIKQAATADYPARVINIASNAGILPPHRRTDYAYSLCQYQGHFLGQHKPCDYYRTSTGVIVC